ncbi:MAG: flavodoxin family protein [Bacteroidales bacterium]|nr:flavodoxin family protein [Bacteroidales bacterium]
MNILILNASPRRGGNISQMLDAISAEAQAQGATVTLEHVQQLSVRPCVACMKCRSSKQCVMPPDDAQRILALIEAADAIVVGSPCYWGNIPGTLKTLFDRMVYGLMGESSRALPKPLHKGKKAILVSTCSTPWPFNILAHQSRGAIRALKEILGWSGFKIVATIEKGGTLRHPEFTESDRRKCQKAVKRLHI